MAIIVEDGTGMATAESLCSVATATTYHAARGNAAWAALASDTVREQCLRKAADYLEQVYRLRWAGVRKVSTQALSWPRYNVPMLDVVISQYYPSTSVPTIVVNACAELALKASTGALAPDITRLKKRVKIDVIETEYVDGTSPYTKYRAIDNMLEPFFSGSSSMNIEVVRA